jgi:hypothetical protein
MDLASLRRWWPLAAVALLLGFAALAAGNSSLRIGRVESSAPQVPAAEDFSKPVEPSFSPPPEREIVAAEPRELPSWLLPVAAGIGTLVVLVIVALLARALLRAMLARPRRAPRFEEDRRPEAASADEVVAAVEAGLVELSDADTDPRRAVIACWLRLEQAAAAAGTPRQVGDSPTDLVGRLLSAHEVSADVLAALAQAYREARYATRNVEDRMRVQARSALQRIRAELTAGARA